MAGDTPRCDAYKKLQTRMPMGKRCFAEIGIVSFIFVTSKGSGGHSPGADAPTFVLCAVSNPGSSSASTLAPFTVLVVAQVLFLPRVYTLKAYVLYQLYIAGFLLYRPINYLFIILLSPPGFLSLHSHRHISTIERYGVLTYTFLILCIPCTVIHSRSTATACISISLPSRKLPNNSSRWCSSTSLYCLLLSYTTGSSHASHLGDCCPPV